MSDTPETDALISVGLENADRECVPAEFARKLEQSRDDWSAMCGRYKQERDEVREDAERWESSSDAMERAGAEQARRADENREWALKAERERDQARKERDQLKEALLIMENLLKPGIELFPEIGEILKQGGAK